MRTLINQPAVLWAVFRCALLCLVLAGCGAPAASDNPIIEMLSHVPESASQQPGLWISYIDYEAALASRGLTPLTEQQAQDVTLLRQYGPAFGGLRSDLNLIQYVRVSAEMRETVGFTFFDLRREVVYGQPSSVGVVLAGEFDAASIEAALAARGYTESEIAGVRVWCGPMGCDKGQYVDIDNREQGNPFGGFRGSQEPLLVTDDLLVNSANINVFTALVETHSGEQPALSENADYRAVAEAAYSLGNTVQVHFFPHAEDYWYPLEIPPEVNPAAVEVLSTFGSLPRYLLWAMADIRSAEQQTAALLLVYDSAEQAAAGGAELYYRMTTECVPVLGLTEEDADEIGGKLQSATVYESSTGKFVAIVPITYPMPTMQLDEDTPISYQSGGRLYLTWMSLVFPKRIQLYLVSEILP